MIIYYLICFQTIAYSISRVNACNGFPRVICYGNCFWDDAKRACFSPFRKCDMNIQEGCVLTEHCIWNGTQCTDDICLSVKDKIRCLEDYRCTWENDFRLSSCHNSDKYCINLKYRECIRDKIKSYSICYWSNINSKCLPIYRECSMNNKPACNNAQHCEWKDKRCSLIVSYGDREECSNSIHDVDYHGTQNVTCDGTPCLDWKYAYLHSRSNVFDGFFQYDNYISAKNFCRQKYTDHLAYSFMNAWCYCSTPKYSVLGC